MLADLATRHLRWPLSAFTFRILKPVFLGTPFYCAARDENGSTLVQTLDAAHDVCAFATVE
jgi:hydroxyacyl-ACP dehydratase HTD2-like protein with hotdog domain